MAVGVCSTAGYNDYLPEHPATIDETDPAGYDSTERLKRLDQYGIGQQLLYPNLLSFYSLAILKLADIPFQNELVRIYNDFVTEFCAADPERLHALTMLPFWDIDASIAEMERALGMGHRGIIFAPDYQKVGLPSITSGHWDPIIDAAQATSTSINFHIGFAGFDFLDYKAFTHNRRKHAMDFSLMMLSNARTIADIIMSGLCDRFPRVNFVSVESGFGHLPYLIQALDWQWENDGCRRDFPNSPFPSAVFRRQIYTTYWFERIDAGAAELYADNAMFSTDFPHPTSLSPGPNSSSLPPVEMARMGLGDASPDVARKLIHDNAARVYHLS
jgi:predicted TIM-barrel fold metal-dependent hydrolase